jgi:hypothetical protein
MPRHARRASPYCQLTAGALPWLGGWAVCRWDLSSLDSPPKGTAGAGCRREDHRGAEPHAFHRPSLLDAHRTAAWSSTGRRSTVYRRSISGRLYRPPPLGSTPLRSPRPSHSVSFLSWAHSHLKPWRLERPRAPARSCTPPTEEEDVSFEIRSLWFPLILRSVYVYCKFPRNPPRKIPPFTHTSHPRLFQI